MALVELFRKDLGHSPNHVAFSPHTRQVAFVDAACRLLIFDLDADKIIRVGPMSPDYRNASDIVWHPNNRIYTVCNKTATNVVFIVSYNQKLEKQHETVLGDARYSGCVHMAIDRSGNIVASMLARDMVCFVKLDVDCAVITDYVPLLNRKELAGMQAYMKSIVCDANDNILWTRYPDRGLHCYNMKTDTVVGDALGEYCCIKLTPLNGGSFVVEMSGGISLFCSSRLERTKTRYSYTNGHAIHEDCDGNLWWHGWNRSGLIRIEECLQWQPTMFLSLPMRRHSGILSLAWWKCVRDGGALESVPVELIFEVVNALWYMEMFGKLVK